MNSKKIYISDVTLRDGSHAIRHQYTVEQARQIGLLNVAEAQALLDHDRRIMSVIHVDDFDPRELGASHV